MEEAVIVAAVHSLLLFFVKENVFYTWQLKAALHIQKHISKYNQ
jgi:hypothetical protein